MNEDKFGGLFQVDKPIIGMIHLAGDSRRNKIRRALEELSIYEEEGVDGVIIEDYHGDMRDVSEALRQSSGIGLNIIRGVNTLRDPYAGFKLAQDSGARFVQFDSVQGKNLDLESYNEKRIEYPGIVVLGGVGFKYVAATGNPLEIDLREGIERCDAVVTTGRGTGIETPMDKLREYKALLENFPLIIGAGVNVNNAYEQLKIADGAIVGSCFKPRGDTSLPIDRRRVRDLMDIVREIRRKINL